VQFMPIPSEPSPGPHLFLREEPWSAKILVSEDPFISSFLRTVLQRHGHQVAICEPRRASEYLRTGRMNAKIVITNTPEAFLDFAGTLPVLYIAACPDPALALQFSACRTLRKPFRNDDLLQAVEELARCAIP